MASSNEFKEKIKKLVYSELKTSENKFYEAIKVIDEGLKNDPKSVPLSYHKAFAYYHIYQVNFNKNPIKSALQIVDNLIEVDMGFTALFFLKSLLLCSESSSEGEKYYETIKMMDANDEDSKHAKGLAILKLSKDEDKTKEKAAMELFNEINLCIYFSAFQEMMNVCRRQNNYSLGLAKAESFVQANKTVILGYDWKGYMLESLKEYEKALEPINEWIKLLPKGGRYPARWSNENPFSKKTNLLIQLTKFEEALEAADQWLKGYPLDINAWFEKFNIIQKNIKEKKFQKMMKYAKETLFSVKLSELYSANSDRFSFYSSMIEPIENQFNEVFEMIAGILLDEQIKPYLSGVNSCEVPAKELIEILDNLIKQEDKYSSRFQTKAMIFKGAILYAMKEFQLALKCLEDDKLKELKDEFFKDYCISLTYLALNKKKEALINCEVMMNFCFWQDRYHWSSHIPSYHRFVFKHGVEIRDEILNESFIKEIYNTKRKTLTKDSESLLNKAFSMTFQGPEINYPSAVNLLNDALKNEPDAAVIKFYKIVFECIATKKWDYEIVKELNEIISLDIGFLPAYYLKKNIYSEIKEYNKCYFKGIRLLKPVSQDDYFMKAFVSLELSNKPKKQTFSYLEKCTDKKFEKKVLDLKRIYYEAKEEKEKALECAQEFLQKYPNENIENIFKLLVELNKLAEALSYGLRLTKEINDNLKLYLKKFLEKSEEAMLTKEGLIHIMDKSSLLNFLDFIIDYDPNTNGLVYRALNLKGVLLLSLDKKEESFSIFEKAVNMQASESGNFYDKETNWMNNRMVISDFICYKNSIYHIHLAKAAWLTKKIEIARSSCEKGFAYLCTIRAENKQIYYQNILINEIPNIYPQEFISQMKQKLFNPMEENAKNLYNKAVQLLHLYPLDKENLKKASTLLAEAAKQSKSFLIQFQKEKCEESLNKIISLFDQEPLFVGLYYAKANRISDSSCKPYYELIKNFEPNEKDEESNYEKGEFLFQSLKKPDEALPYLKRVSINYMKAHLNIATIYKDNKEISKSIEIYDNLIKAYPNHEHCYEKKLSLLKEFQQIKEHLILTGTNLASSKNIFKSFDPFFEVKNTVCTPEQKLELALLYFNFFQNTYSSSSHVITWLEYVAYDSNGFNLAKTKKTANELLEILNKMSNYKDIAKNIKGSILLSQNKAEEALTLFEECVKAYDSYALYLCNKGLALALLNKPKAAFPVFEKAYSALKMKKITYTSSESQSTKEYVENTIVNQRKQILKGLIDDINKHAVVLEEVKELGVRVNKLERQMTLKKIENSDDVMQDLKKVTEKIKENDQNAEKLASEKERLLKTMEDAGKATGIVELTAQVESFKAKANKAKEEKDLLENQYKELEKKVNLLFQSVEKVNSKVNEIDSEVKVQNEKVEKIEIVQKEEAKKIEEHEEVLRQGGVYAKVEIKNRMNEMKAENPELYAYCKTFYWTMLNYFGSYRNLSTNLFEKNVDVDQTSNKIITEGIKKVASFGMEIAKGVPFVGNVIGSIDGVIDLIYGTYKEKAFDFKVKVVNKIIQKKFTLEEDISLEVGKLAVDMALLRKTDILKAESPGKIDKIWGWLNKQMENLNKLVFPYVEMNNEKGAKLALKDIVSLFAFFFKNHEIILSREDSLSKQIENIVLFGSLDNLLREAVEDSENKQKDMTMSNISQSSKTQKKNEKTKKKQSRKCVLI